MEWEHLNSGSRRLCELAHEYVHRIAYDRRGQKDRTVGRRIAKQQPARSKNRRVGLTSGNAEEWNWRVGVAPTRQMLNEVVGLCFPRRKNDTGQTRSISLSQIASLCVPTCRLCAPKLQPPTCTSPASLRLGIMLCPLVPSTPPSKPQEASHIFGISRHSFSLDVQRPQEGKHGSL